MRRSRYRYLPVLLAAVALSAAHIQWSPRQRHLITGAAIGSGPLLPLEALPVSRSYSSGIPGLDFQSC